MDVQINGKPLAEFAPDAAKYFETSTTVMTLGMAALVRAVDRAYEARIARLEINIKDVLLANQALIDENRTLKADLEVVQAKLARPKAGRTKSTGRLRREVPDDADPTTKELMDEAYSGKQQPHSKSEMRRLNVMKEKK